MAFILISEDTLNLFVFVYLESILINQVIDKQKITLLFGILEASSI